MNSLQKLASEIRERRHETFGERNAKVEDYVKQRGDFYDGLFRDKVGEDILTALEESDIKRFYVIGAAKDYLRFEGFDLMLRPRNINLPINEKILMTFNPEDLILILDKYLIRGYELPKPMPDGNIMLNLRLDDLGPAVVDFSES